MFRGGQTQVGVAVTQLPSDLKVRWSYEIDEAITSTATIVNNIVYVGGEDGFVYALHADSGKLKWKFKAGEIIKASPTVLNNTVLVGNDEGIMHAIDASTGKPQWTFHADGEIISSVNHHDEKLVFGSYDGFVYCLFARDGHLIWKHETEGRIHGTPAIIEDHVLVAGCDEYLRVLSLADGKNIRSVRMGSVTGVSPAIRDSITFEESIRPLVTSVHKSEPVFGSKARNRLSRLPITTTRSVTAAEDMMGKSRSLSWYRQTTFPRVQSMAKTSPP